MPTEKISFDLNTLGRSCCTQIRAPYTLLRSNKLYILYFDSYIGYEAKRFSERRLAQKLRTYGRDR